MFALWGRCSINIPFLRRHDPDQVQRVLLFFSFLVKGKPENPSVSALRKEGTPQVFV